MSMGSPRSFIFAMSQGSRNKRVLPLLPTFQCPPETVLNPSVGAKVKMFVYHCVHLIILFLANGQSTQSDRGHHRPGDSRIWHGQGDGSAILRRQGIFTLLHVLKRKLDYRKRVFRNGLHGNALRYEGDGGHQES